MSENIMPMFKVQEPFMAAPDKGHGYFGVMLRDLDDDKLQCHVCGKWFRSIANHSRLAHDLKAHDYKFKYGLPLGLGMVAMSTASKHSSRAIEQNENCETSPLIKAADSLARKRKALKISGKPLMLLQGRKSMAFKNKHGLCDDQIMARYTVVKAIVKDEPEIPQLKKYDRTLYDAIRRRFGSLHGFRHAKGFRLKKSNVGSRYENIELIAHLREWAAKHKTLPTYSGFNASRNGYHASASTILGHFGSWNAALQAAGLR